MIGYGDSNDRGYQSDQMGDNLDTVDLGDDFYAVKLGVFGPYSDHSCAADSYSWKCWGYDHSTYFTL